jgi:phage terminase small subunit
MKITPRVHNFIIAVCDGRSLTDAYRENYECSRMKAATVNRLAHDLRHDPDVSAEIDRYLADARANAVAGVTEVANEFLRVAFADPGKIVQHRRLNCRYCHGVKHHYQWRDSNEYAKALMQAKEDNDARRRMKPAKREIPLPGDEGGYGFAFNAPPHAACPHCRGEGKPDVFIADTTQLTPEDRRLIERVKVTKDGIEIRFRNQQDALTKAGQMLGGFKQTVVLQNPDGSAVSAAPTVIALTPDEAAAKYKEWMDGGAKPA